MSRGYTETTRQWAIKTYNDTRDQYRSRLECCTPIAEALGAHVNTVVRWINAELGRPRLVTEEELPQRLRDLEDEVRRLRQANLELTERVSPAWGAV